MDLDSCGLGELDGRDADAARRRVDEHPFTRPDRSVPVQRGPRGRVVDRHSGALLEGQRVRQRHRVDGLDVHDLGVAAEARAGQHPFADASGVDTGTDRLDRARHLVTDHARRFGGLGVQADTGEMVGEVHARGAHCDAHLARRRRRRIGPLLDLEDREITVLGDDDGAHGYAVAFASSNEVASCAQTINRSGS